MTASRMASYEWVVSRLRAESVILVGPEASSDDSRTITAPHGERFVSLSRAAYDSTLSSTTAEWPAVKSFEAGYGARFPKAVAKITDDVEVLLAVYDFPAEHWIHLRTTNPIESTFATVRHRTKITRGPGSRAAGLAMAFKLIEATQDR